MRHTRELLQDTTAPGRCTAGIASAATCSATRWCASAVSRANACGITRSCTTICGTTTCRRRQSSPISPSRAGRSKRWYSKRSRRSSSSSIACRTPSGVEPGKFDVTNGLHQDVHARVVGLFVQRMDEESGACRLIIQRGAAQLFAVEKGDGHFATAHLRLRRIGGDVEHPAIEIAHEEDRFQLSERHGDAATRRRVPRRPYFHGAAVGYEVRG